MGNLRPGLVFVFLSVLLSCTTTLERGEELYRQGDLRGAIGVWSEVEPGSSEYERAQERLVESQAEYARRIQRYMKRADFFASEGRLAEAVLYYRLTYKLAPDRRELQDRVQQLVREQRSTETSEIRLLREALDAGDLKMAGEHAANLERINPLDPAIQLEIGEVEASTGAQVLAHLSEGEAAYARGEAENARQSFESVLVLDPQNSEALGYLEYIKRSRVPRSPTELPKPPSAVSPEEILAEGHYQAAITSEDAGRVFKAISEYNAALKVNPQHSESREARARLRERLVPRVEELYTEGKRFFQEEDLHNALRVWRQALLIQPRDERIGENIDRAQKMLDRLEEIQTGG